MEQHATSTGSGMSIIDYYASLLMSPDLRQQAGSDPVLIKQRLQRYSDEYLNELKPYINDFTDESRSLLLHLVDETVTQWDIDSTLVAAFGRMRGFSYADTAVIITSLHVYDAKGYAANCINLSSNDDTLKALHRVVQAIRFTTPAGKAPEESLLESSGTVIGNRTVYTINDRELFDFTLKHASESVTISRLIREYGEVNLPALRSVLENGSSNAYQITSEELYTHLDALAQRPEVRAQMNTNYRYTKGNLKRGVSFLNRILPIINQNTEDSRSLLLNLLEKSSDEDIQRAVDTQPLLKGLTYKDTAKVLESLKWCEQLDSPDAVRSNPDQLVALHLITKAVVSMVGDRAISKGHDLVAMTGAFIDTDSVYVLKDKGLIDIALNHPEHAESIADLITSSGTVHYPAIMFLLQGGTKPLSEGAL